MPCERLYRTAVKLVQLAVDSWPCGSLVEVPVCKTYIRLEPVPETSAALPLVFYRLLQLLL